MATVKAVPVKALLNASGGVVPMKAGPCLWCGQWVSSQRDVAGCTTPHDPAWATDGGDFGCDASPETCEDGCGGHARPYDLARALLQEKGA